MGALKCTNGVENQNKVMRGISGCRVIVPDVPPRVAKIALIVGVSNNQEDKAPQDTPYKLDMPHLTITKSHLHGNRWDGSVPNYIGLENALLSTPKTAYTRVCLNRRRQVSSLWEVPIDVLTEPWYLVEDMAGEVVYGTTIVQPWML